jgi:hypothetical protein
LQNADQEKAMFRRRKASPTRKREVGKEPKRQPTLDNGPSDHPSTSEHLNSLIDQIRQYDHYRRKLEQEGGTVRDIHDVTELLTRDVVIPDRYGGTRSVRLSDQQALRTAVRSAGNWDARVEVRQLNSRMPVYYLCRVRWDTWAEYSLITEDLYRSPGYPSTDERFVMLMHGGHEQHYLRLSHFRSDVAARMPPSELAELAVDEALYDVGRYVFQAAWHDDQRVGMITANHFGLNRFRQAVELLYLCLGGELCELRQAIDDSMRDFFETVYPQKAIRAFLDELKRMDGRALNAIPREALTLYARLSREFARFVQTKVFWGDRSVETPLYKLLLANLNRLENVSSKLTGQTAVRLATERLEQAAGQVVNRILEIE